MASNLCSWGPNLPQGGCVSMEPACCARASLSSHWAISVLQKWPGIDIYTCRLQNPLECFVLAGPVAQLIAVGPVTRDVALHKPYGWGRQGQRSNLTENPICKSLKVMSVYCILAGPVAQLIAVGLATGDVALHKLYGWGRQGRRSNDAAYAEPLRVLSMYDWGYGPETLGPASSLQWSPDCRALAVSRHVLKAVKTVVNTYN